MAIKLGKVIASVDAITSNTKKPAYRKAGLKLELTQYVAVLEQQVSAMHQTLQHLKNELHIRDIKNDN